MPETDASGSGPVDEGATRSGGSIGQALAYPKSGDHWIRTVLIGGVLILLGALLVVPFVFLLGYYVRVFRSGAYGERAPPRFDDWKGLFVDGVKLLGIVFVYGLVANVPLLGVTAGIEPGVGVLGQVLTAVTFAVTLVVAYVVPAAVTNFAVEESFTAAFDVGTIVDGAFDWQYFKAAVGGIVVYLLFGLIAMALSFVLVGVFLFFYVMVAVFYHFGRGYGNARGIDARATTPTD